ncbi:MAG TPA: glycosyl hydrolase 53 family protein [Vicinamibacterales bacterium]|nr:glycosyl hydrolase 53 family protein [Vicinamibacterales bacterium]
MAAACLFFAQDPDVRVAAQRGDVGSIVGADISSVQAAEDRGVKYSDGGVSKDILEILRDHGFNYIRLRVFNDPTKPTPRDRPYGGDNAATRRFVDAALGQRVAFDVLGQSCYTRWQGQPAGWKANFDDLAARYPTLSFVVAEVGFEVKEAMEVMRSLPDGRGLGTFVWEPTSNLNGQSLFDGSGAVIPEKMAVYDELTRRR